MNRFYFLKIGQRTLVTAILAVTLALNSGCFAVAVGAAGAAGAGAVAYVRGELDASLSNNFESVVAASERAIGQMQFAKISEKKDALAAVIIGRTALDKKVTVTVTKTADNLTRVQIRIGLFGDEMVSRALLDQIKADV